MNRTVDIYLCSAEFGIESAFLVLVDRMGRAACVTVCTPTKRCCGCERLEHDGQVEVTISIEILCFIYFLSPNAVKGSRRVVSDP